LGIRACPVRAMGLDAVSNVKKQGLNIAVCLNDLTTRRWTSYLAGRWRVIRAKGGRNA
jgi:hypothetical protein